MAVKGNIREVPGTGRHKPAPCAHTLMEVLLVLAIGAIAALAVVPNLRVWYMRERLGRATHAMMSTLARGRVEARAAAR